MSAPRAELITVGTELLRHGRVDTNSVELGRRLTDLGFVVERRATVSDDVGALAETLTGAAARAPLVLITGGLGPTADDVTRDALAQAFGRALRNDPGLARGLQARFRALGQEMPESNLRQAQVPDGAEALDNPEGSAPGLWLDHPAGAVIALPGPPREMRVVLEGIGDRLRRRFRPPAAARRSLATFGLGESALEDRIAGLYPGDDGAQLSVLARPGLVELLVVARHPDPARAAARADELVGRLRERLADVVFAEGEITLAALVGDLLRRGGWTLSAAESCTGGALGAELTGVPGSSEYFLGGLVTYSDRSKEREAGVPAALLRAHGAVSEEVARALAEGARARFGADFGLSITGVAGPGGGSAAKPVGLVWLGLAGADGTVARRRRFRGDRDRVRRWSVVTALHLLRSRLQEGGGRA